MKSRESAPLRDEALSSSGSKPTFDLMVRSERLAAAAAIFRMSGLLLDFMISEEGKCRRVSIQENNREGDVDRA